MNDTATKRDRIVIAANGGSILANQILGCEYTAPMLARKIEAVQRRLDRIKSGRIPSNSDAEYVQIIANQVGALADTMRYNHPDAAYYARLKVIHAFRFGGLSSVITAIAELKSSAESTAALLYA